MPLTESLRSPRSFGPTIPSQQGGCWPGGTPERLRWSLAGKHARGSFGSAASSQSYWHGQKARVVDVENIQFPVSPAARAWEAQSLRAGESPSTLLRYESQAGASLVPSSESLYWRLCSWDTTRIA